ncbi:MAG: proton-conducting membrane transporter [Lachnospiraceae bacterium]|nr:proton-conducting membrane transporter [Lachnospiraceae bacterium]
MVFILISILLPILSGAFLLISKEKVFDLKRTCIYTGFVLVLWLVFVTVSVFTPAGPGEVLALNEYLVLYFAADKTGKLFAVIMAIVWVLAGFYSFEYMKHEEETKRFFGFYLTVPGALMGLCFAGNLFTFYAFYEFMTLLSFALVLHNRTRQALMASLKYLFYSFAGAYMVLFGLYFTYRFSTDKTATFLYGGIIDRANAPEGILMISMLLMILGFSVKGGMFPMHGWLPTAHPVAPSPASAVLSGLIVKAGVLGIVRVIFYIFGSDFFAGSYVQTVCLILSITTVFMGSMLAYREKVLKKRLAYSTVSQVSYILFALFTVNETAFEGAMLHVAAHACIKSALFLCAGSIIFITGCTSVDELRGIGKKMPVLMWCFTIVSLGLIGIPPLGGFTSKWFICVGALKSGTGVFSILGPAVLLVSALLTAGYLLPISINAFLPGDKFETDAITAGATGSAGSRYHAYQVAKEPGRMMLVPIIILTILSVLAGMFPEVML